MRYKGKSNWPPVWTQAKGAASRTVTGEIGVLAYVYASENVSNKFYLVINHQQEIYIGNLIFDEHSFCAKVARVIRSHIGRSIKDIGDLEL